MSQDAEIDAAQALKELRLTEAAFNAMREEYIEKAISAPDQPGIMAAVAAARLVDEVRMRLRAYIDTDTINKSTQEQ